MGVLLNLLIIDIQLPIEPCGGGGPWTGLHVITLYCENARVIAVLVIYNKSFGNCNSQNMSYFTQQIVSS